MNRNNFKNPGMLQQTKPLIYLGYVKPQNIKSLPLSRAKPEAHREIAAERSRASREMEHS